MLFFEENSQTPFWVAHTVLWEENAESAVLYYNSFKLTSNEML